MAKYIQRLLEKTNNEKCHIATHSFGGIDARAAISMFGANKYVNSLTTICTPHHGMELLHAAESVKHQGKGLENLERVFEVLGITGRAAKEFYPHNIKAFNDVC